MKSGVYETIYGNACEYIKGDKEAYDLDSRENIPLDFVDFTIFIRDID